MATAAAFKPETMQSCVITIEGVCGDLLITGIGTAWLVVTTAEGEDVVLVIHQCLQGNGEHNLLSVSQILQLPAAKVVLTNDDPVVRIMDEGSGVATVIPFRGIDGVFVVPHVVLSPTDPRLRKLRRVTMTPNVACTPATVMFPEGHPAAGSPIWRSVVHQSPRAAVLNGKFVVPSGLALMGFRDRISKAVDAVVLDSTSRPAARRHYSPSVPSSMADLSTRMMGMSYQRLKHTIDVSKGLNGSIKGGVRPNRFPQGTLKRGQVPAVKKRLVHHLHKASVAEVVFTDTFMSNDKVFARGQASGQAFVCCRSRYGHVVCLKSRKEVGRAFRRFCADVFCPLILVRDNIAEQKFGEMLAVCEELLVQSAFSTPHTPEEDHAEGFIGRVFQLATFAMMFAGAPPFMWRFAIISAVFVHDITAGWCSFEQLWATPYELVFGEPFPDEGNRFVPRLTL